MSTHDNDSAARFAAHRSEAEARLRREMDALGLHERHGWKINEVTREVDGGIELVLRPLHLRLDPPAGLECVVWICSANGMVESTCRPDTSAPER